MHWFVFLFDTIVHKRERKGRIWLIIARKKIYTTVIVKRWDCIFLLKKWDCIFLLKRWDCIFLWFSVIIYRLDFILSADPSFCRAYKWSISFECRLWSLLQQQQSSQGSHVFHDGPCIWEENMLCTIPTTFWWHWFARSICQSQHSLFRRRLFDLSSSISIIYFNMWCFSALGRYLWLTSCSFFLCFSDKLEGFGWPPGSSLCGNWLLFQSASSIWLWSCTDRGRFGTKYYH